jgi:pyruvate dehydrogenase E2 component (dihydrolipoamide acetyltransferase)
MFVFNFPDVGEGIHEGVVVEWLVAEGATVAEDEALLKVETDKAIVELPSPRAGVVATLHAAAGATIHVGDPLVTIAEDGEEVEGGSAPVRPEPAAEEPAEEPAAETGADSGPPAAPPARPLATPKTRRLARELGVDLGRVRGSGSGGRITDDDVRRAAESGPEPSAAPSAPAPRPAARPAGEPGELVERVPISHLRKVIAGAMQASKHTAAHVTHVDEADVTELLAQYRGVKAEVEAEHGVRFTLLPVFIKALVAVLQKYPMFNATVDEEAGEILLKRFYNIGIAVDTPEGLIVPVLRDADQKDMVTLAAEVADLAERARNRQLGLDELRGGTCTITNIGPLGGVFATPIINQPELAIVGLHAIKERPAVVDGEIVVRQQMFLSVSFDHRWIDGASAARFMSDMVKLVSNPSLLMVRL